MVNAQAALLEFKDNPAFMAQWKADIAKAVRENSDYWAMLDPAEWNKRSPAFRTQLIHMSNDNTPFTENLQKHFPGGLNAILRGRPINVASTREEAIAQEAQATQRRANEYINQAGINEAQRQQEVAEQALQVQVINLRRGVLPQQHPVNQVQDQMTGKVVERKVEPASVSVKSDLDVVKDALFIGPNHRDL